jgi:uncharacterized protein YabE (DUF348 family)
MYKFFWLGMLVFLLSACQGRTTVLVTIRDGSQTYRLTSAQRIPDQLLADAKLKLGDHDRLLYLGTSIPLDQSLPVANAYALEIRRAVPLTLVQPTGQQILQTSALNVGQALAEAGITLYAADRLEPPAGTPLNGPLTVQLTPSQPEMVSVDGKSIIIRSSAATVGQALAEAGIPLEGLDTSQPAESQPLPADGTIRIHLVNETVTLTQRSLPFNTTTQLSGNLELDQQTLLQGGVPGLAVARLRVRSEDGVEVSRSLEPESIIRPPQDRIIGYGTHIVIRTAVVDGQTITYWRVLQLYATAYSPCTSAGIPGKCYTGTSSGKPAGKGIVGMVYSWYLLFGDQPLYIPGYGPATVGDTGGGAPAGNHYWIDLGYNDGDPNIYAWGRWVTVYFLTPVQEPNPGYILP